MADETYDWTITKGDTETLTVTYNTNLNGFTGKAQARETYESTAALFTIESPSSGISITTGLTASTAVLTLSSSVTSALTAPFVGVWDLQFSDASSPPVIRTPVRGAFIVRPEVTRP
jgi:hypothetical protein